MNREEYLDNFDKIRQEYNEKLAKLDSEFIRSSSIKIGDAVVETDRCETINGIWEYDVVQKVNRIHVDHGSGEFAFTLRNFFTGEESRSRKERQLKKITTEEVYEKVKRLI